MSQCSHTQQVQLVVKMPSGRFVRVRTLLRTLSDSNLETNPDINKSPPMCYHLKLLVFIDQTSPFQGVDSFLFQMFFVGQDFRLKTNCKFHDAQNGKPVVLHYIYQPANLFAQQNLRQEKRN